MVLQVNRQRHYCKDYHYTVENKSDVKSQETRKLALEMYPEGLSFRAIGGILKISHVTVYNWVKNGAKKYRCRKKKNALKLLSEMHTYVGKKNYCWVWIAVDRLGQRFISFVCGAGSTKTGIRLWEQIKNI